MIFIFGIEHRLGPAWHHNAIFDIDLKILINIFLFGVIWQIKKVHDFFNGKIHNKKTSLHSWCGINIKDRIVTSEWLCLLTNEFRRQQWSPCPTTQPRSSVQCAISVDNKFYLFFFCIIRRYLFKSYCPGRIWSRWCFGPSCRINIRAENCWNGGLSKLVTITSQS